MRYLVLMLFCKFKGGKCGNWDWIVNFWVFFWFFVGYCYNCSYLELVIIYCVGFNDCVFKVISLMEN